jgi:hypothetical protein
MQRITKATQTYGAGQPQWISLRPRPGRRRESSERRVTSAKPVPATGGLRVSIPGTGASEGQGSVILTKAGRVRLVYFPVLAKAMLTAERIHARIGVKVNWCSGGKADISIQFDRG